MQIPFPKNKYDPMKGYLERFGTRAEHNRLFLFDKEQPQKSVFNFQHFRHDVHSKEDAHKFMSQASLVPQRLMDWKEQPEKQKFDKKVTGKVGVLHL
mmetsp:Transcript_39228/g.28969  ORF Transcript_39228/g.28969 Transcript_39228/m.28969 type:complete len:97 (+) Transcript_39228:787-1077(+)